MLSAVQMLLFVLVSNFILEIHGMTFSFWLVLFTTSCFANILGLNISSAFNSAVTVYILIPLLLIPQMILSGLLFNFDKLNELITKKGQVPLVADLMVSRWAYEALAVRQFKDNEYEALFFQYEMTQSQADYKSAYLADELKKRNAYILENAGSTKDSVRRQIEGNAAMIRLALEYEATYTGPRGQQLAELLSPEHYTSEVGKALDVFFDQYKRKYQRLYNEQGDLLEHKMAFYEKNGWSVTANKNRYYNESLSDLVRNVNTKNRMLPYGDRLIQQIDPVFQDPAPANVLDYRAAFFVPSKNMLGIRIDTFTFNLAVIWTMSLVLYLLLYGEVMRKTISFADKTLGNRLARKEKRG